ncbi:hypothetical protein AVEN_136642-1 [Araneus ventricosus]|uniref:Uncharacterized protein n=1 Tax=Araneus ventricosus TaxID=182803 RepID=A0A4Y2C9G8_ARAVE|nr:hypothetical protein AVEN_136642-1 [Araneus ventricosus]
MKKEIRQAYEERGCTDTWLFERPHRLTVEKITQVDEERRITLWLLPMKMREREQRFVVGETVSSPDKSPKLEPFGHASEGRVKGVLKLEFWTEEEIVFGFE